MAADRRKLIRNAERLISRGKLNAAIDEYLKVLDKHPEDTNTLNRVGDLLARLKRLDEAIGLFRQAANHFSEQGFFEKAIAIYKKILRFDPHQHEITESMAELQARHGLVNEARRNYEAVAQAYQRTNAIGPATAAFQKLVDLEPDDASHRLHLAEVLKKQGKKQDAMAQYRAIAQLLVDHGKAEEAVRVCREALEVDPGDLEFVAGMIAELQQSGHTREAELFLAFATEKNPEAARLTLAPAEEVAAEAEPATAEVLDSEVEAVPETEVTAGEALEAQEEEAIERAAIEEAIRAVQAESVELEPEVEEPEAEELEFEIELDALEPAPAQAEPVATEAEPEPAPVAAEPVATEPVATEPVATEPAATEPVATEAEPELAPAEAVAAAEPAPVAEVEDEGLRELLIEADVLARYGLEDKAIEKLEEILELEPQHLDAHFTLITLNLERGNHQRVSQLAGTARGLATRQRRQDDWESLREQLLAEGYQVDDGRVTPPAPPPPEEPPVEAVVKAVDTAVAAEVAKPADELTADDLSWLDEVAAGGDVDQADDSEAFDVEEEFFDLASELERELGDEGGLLAEELVIAPEEQSIEEIVEGFRKGMAETLSSEDYDTHYNLGIAYREMGLVDEAISEFQLAAKDPRYLVDCCSLLAACFMEKGFPELAIKWYHEGLGSPTISEEETLGLAYELGELYLTIGETGEARQRFVEIYGVNSDYRDVSKKLAQIDQQT